METSGAGAVAGAVTSMFAGMMNNRANRRAQEYKDARDQAFTREMFDKTNAFNREMAAWENQNNYHMRAEDKRWADEAALREYNRQKEFASMGIQWKVADAKAAGLHPLAVLGGAGAGYSPTIALPGSYPSASARAGSVAHSGGSAALSSGPDFGAMGQNLMRAMLATEDAEQRERRELEMEHLRLRNRLVDAQITETYSNIMGQPQNPPFPSAGGPTSPSGAIKVEPSRSVSHLPGSPHMEAARTPFGKTFDMGGGASIVLPSQAAAESLEALGPFAGPTALTLSGLRHWFHGPATPPAASLPPQWTWKWDPFKQAFTPTPPASQSINRLFERRGPSGPARGNRGQVLRR